jgi:DNA-binding MarR family transcriptional regulator
MADSHARGPRLAVAGFSTPGRPGPEGEAAIGGSDTDGLPGYRAAMAGLRPTPEELQISARILLHLAQQPRFERGAVVPAALTQAGIAESLGSTQAAVSNALRRLVRGGVMEVELAHVRQQWKRLKVYRLTPEGERLARHIREQMG